MSPRVIFDDGSDYLVTLIGYRPSQTGQPPVSKVPIRHVCLLLRVYGDRTKTEKQTLNPAPGKKSRKSTPFRMGTWNVRTMTTGMTTTDLNEVQHLRKTFIIDRELTRLKVDIAALQETRLAGSGSVKERNFTFFWKGLDEDERRIHGVGFAIHNRLLNKISTPRGISERIIVMEMSTKNGQAHFISAYAPTLTTDSEKKDKFYDDLQNTIDNVPKSDQLFLMGDFNARVGAEHQTWPICLGQFGLGKVNENGQRLLEFCTSNNLCITNTFYNGKDRHKVSWCHPRSGHWHQIDFVIVRKKDVNSVKQTRSFYSADCNSDHLLIITKAKMVTKKIPRSEMQRKPKINVRNTSNPTMKVQFQKYVEEQLPTVDCSSPDDMWNNMKSAIHDAASRSFGTDRPSKVDWIEAYASTLMPLLEHKRRALIEHTRKPTEGTKQKLQNIKSKLQRETRKCANEYWNKLCFEIQQASDMGNTRRMYEMIRIAIGPTVSKVAPLKSKTGEQITDRGKQLDRWVEHYSDLYASERNVDGHLKETLPQLPEMAELDIPPTEEELSCAIDELASGKATGNDNIPAEVLKENKDILLPHLHKLLTTCWLEAEIPHDMRDAKIITLYKNKGDKGDCNNYRGISLLSITGKAFARIILKRLQKLAERVLPESQCGFRANRSTMDMIFSIRQLQEKCREQQLPLYTAFIDLTKAFDTVSRSGLYMVLEKVGCPPILLQLIISFHEDMKGTIQFDGSISDSFNINCGVKQGCVLAPTLFSIYFAALLQHAFRDSPGDVYLHWRTDGSLFNLNRLQAKTKIKKTTVRDLLFADDAALVAHSEGYLQTMMNHLSAACKAFGLVISVKKTVILTQEGTTQGHIRLDDKELESVDKFCYLGSTIASNNSLDDEINVRIGKAATTFGRLAQRAWNNKRLNISTKIRIYIACVLSSLLYGSETWTLYSRQEKRLSIFHLRCLRKILGITWQDKIQNIEVLARAHIPSMPAILCTRRLRWLGHVRRMDDVRIPKQLLFGELANGKRPRGRPKLRYKDACKDSLAKCHVDARTWEMKAEDRCTWRATVQQGISSLERNLQTRHIEKRQQRKKAESSTEPRRSSLVCRFCLRNCASNIGRISHERSCKGNPH